MNKNNNSFDIARLGAVILLGASVIFTLSTISIVKKKSDYLRSQTAVLERLLGMRAESSSWNEAMKKFCSLSEKAPDNLSSLIKQAAPEVSAGDIKNIPMESVPGWIFHRKEVTFNEIAVSDMITLIRKTEISAQTGTRPPWRLVKCSMRAIPGKPGIVRSTLLFQAIERE